MSQAACSARLRRDTLAQYLRGRRPCALALAFVRSREAVAAYLKETQADNGDCIPLQSASSGISAESRWLDQGIYLWMRIIEIALGLERNCIGLVILLAQHIASDETGAKFYRSGQDDFTEKAGNNQIRFSSYYNTCNTLCSCWYHPLLARLDLLGSPPFAYDCRSPLFS